ncbi:MAG: alkaline shock response membrane anchor protein AmaP [Dehalococcoidia bacterium]
MNLFNRIVVLLLLVAVITAAIAVAVLAWTIPNKTINWLADAVQWLDDNDGDTEKALLTAGAIVVGVVALAALVVEILPRRRTDVRITDIQGAHATLSTAAIAQRLEEAVRQVPHVADTKAFVRARRKGVEVDMDLHVDPDANLADVTGAASTTIRDVLSSRMHVALVAPPRTRLHYRELRLRRPPNGEPAANSSNTTVVPALPAPAAVNESTSETTLGKTMPPPSEATDAGWKAPASPDNHEDEPQADIDAPATDKPAKPQPETENKFE